ncbi:MAG: 50S ribosomal protein L25 [Patescibacteria group bacterium]
MKKANLDASVREATRQAVSTLRQEKSIPAILYGKNIKNICLAITKKELTELLEKFGANALINLTIGGDKTILVFLKSIQKDPVTEQILHIDFWKIDPNKPLETEIPIETIGESPAIKELEGILVQSKNELQVSALPDKLIAQFDIDISVLKTFEDKIQIKDIPLIEGITILNEPEETIFSVQEPRSEEELAELEEKPEENIESVAVEEKGKIEDEETDETKESKNQEPATKTNKSK